MADRYYVAKRDMQLGRKHVHQGELVQPEGNVNDHLVYGDNTFWTARFDGEPVECTTDGCGRLFATLGQRDRHAERAHAADREYRARRRAEEAQFAAEAEEKGETIGGYPVVEERQGPGGKVPYVSLG